MTRLLLFLSIIFTIVLGILLLSICIFGQPEMGTYFIKVSLVIAGVSTIVIWSLRRYVDQVRADNILKKFILLTTTLVVLLFISEIIIRFVFKDITTTPDNRDYFSRRWIENNVRLNTWGFREREFELIKPDGVCRIAVIGDSFTFGQGIAEEDRFTNLLEKYLNKGKNRYEVLNFSKPGTETIDHIVILKDVVLKAKPDFIILQWYFNDVEGHDRKWRRKSVQLLPFKNLRSTLHSYLYPSSALYYLINQQWILLQDRLGHSGNYIDHLLMRFEDPVSPDSIKYEQTLKRFIDLCKEREIPLGIVLFPHSPVLGKAYPLDYLHSRVLKICNQEGIPCIDLSYTFAPYVENKKLWVNRFDSHPGEFANSLASERLMEKFGQVWFSGTFDKLIGLENDYFIP